MDINLSSYRCGRVALVGRPNVGKSTLLNRILGQKISITCGKPQTTRHRICGIKTSTTAQAIYVDTPGFHREAKRQLNKLMNRAAMMALEDVDVVVFVVESTRWTEEDETLLQQIRRSPRPLIVAVNKVDSLRNKERLLPHLALLAEKTGSDCIIPLSARTGKQVEELARQVEQRLPNGEPQFDDELVTDRSMRFLAAEIVREKLMRRLGQELPYGLAVDIEKFDEKEPAFDVYAVVWVERKGHKGIVIGDQGRTLKDIGTQARMDMERLFDHKVMLHLWVRVREGWADDQRFLQSLGIDEESGAP